jgi:acetyl esterase/lipase
MPLRALLDDRHETRSSREIVDLRTWCRDRSLPAWAAYLGREPGGPDTSPYAAPARADDLSGLPPAYCAVGQLDLVVDENVDYARRLIEAGVPTELHVYPGGIHNFENLAPHARMSADSLLDQQLALTRALHSP